MNKALLALADGTVYEGWGLGYEGESVGEVVFNTAMTGYQEILTDPSYKGQIVLMTCPQIGNYGVNAEDQESTKIWAEGFIVREAAHHPSNWRASASLDAYLRQHRVVGIQGIDTRSLTRHIREHGSQMGVISQINGDPQALIRQAREAPSILGRDLVGEVTCRQAHEWTEGSAHWDHKPSSGGDGQACSQRGYVVVLDLGVKHNILRRLIDSGLRVDVLPASTPVSDIRARNPDGIVLSNGPGDPEGVPYAVDTVRALIGWRPILSICLGHQILGLALGMKAHKLKFGHHGANHPVMDLRTRKVEITSQNHNFAIDVTDGLQPEIAEAPVFQTKWGGVQITHRSLNDQCCEGMIGLEVPFLSVQYHPEASPGPHDSSYLFEEFHKMIQVTHA